MNKRFRVTIILLLLIGLISACGSPNTDKEEPAVEEAVVEEPVVEEAAVEEVADESDSDETATESDSEEMAESEEVVEIVWWSHWAEEQNKRDVLEQVAADYEAANPNVDIEIVYWQKAEMFNAIQNTMTAGEGFPDLFYYDPTAPQIQEAGWVADLSDAIDWDNVEPWAKDAWTADDGGVYAIALEAATIELYANQRLFDELGIEIPDDRQMTQDEFLAAAQTCRDAGYDPFAGAQQWWGSGSMLYWYSLLHQLGGEEFTKYFNGELAVDSPDAVAALSWADEVMAVPAVPETFSTGTVAEAHQNFHTQENACMFPVGSWYTGRAFVPPEDGGQPEDFQLTCMRWPEIEGGVDNAAHIQYAAGALSAAELSPNKDIAMDIINFFAQEEYGNLWMAKTAVQTGIRTNLDTMPETPFSWYFDEYVSCKDGAEFFTLNVFGQPPDYKAVWNQTFNEGLPLRIISLEDGLEMLESARP